MASRLLRASYRMVKLMTEIELNEKITNLLSENPTQQKQSRRPYLSALPTLAVPHVQAQPVRQLQP